MKPEGAADMKLRYDRSEVGWAKRVGMNHALIMNLPVCDRLNLHDLVQIISRGDDTPEAGEVLEREYPRKTGISYEPPTQEVYTELRATVQARGGRIEGMVPGMAMVAHHTPLDLDEINRACRWGSIRGESVIEPQDDDHEEDESAAAVNTPESDVNTPESDVNAGGAS